MRAVKIILFIAVLIGLAQSFRMRKDNKMSLKGSVGKELVIEMKGNATTGFAWYLLTGEYSSSLKALNLESDGSAKDYVTDPNPQGFVGVPGKWLFKFMPLQKGTIRLEFEYKQSWIPTPENREERNITEITVEIN